MAGRGRGASPGKFAGRGMLLKNLGVEKGEIIPDGNQGPPTTFPPLQFHPLPLPIEEDTYQAYRLVVRKEFKEHMQNSEYNIKLDAKKSDVERYSDRYQLLGSRKSTLSFYWPRFPKELHLNTEKKVRAKRKLSAIPNVKRARTKDVNVKEKLDELEKKENLQEEEEEQVEAVEELEEEPDEEMDEGTDYVNSYFDNGDDYINDDDDALEDEGVY